MLENRLKEVRERRKLSPAELADKSGVSRTTIWLIESGKGDNCKANTLIKLASALNCKVSSIFFTKKV